MTVDQAPATFVTSSPPKASSKARCPRGLSRPRSSCWPWTSTARAPISRSNPAGTDAAPTNARLPPSALRERRRINGSPSSVSIPCSASNAWTGWSADSSISADTDAASSPLRTSPASERAPSASPNASSRIDLPAPVSPVSTPSPLSNSSSSCSTSTTLRIASCLSTARPRASASALRSGLRRVPRNEFVRAVIPLAARVIPPKDGRRLLRFLRDAKREVALYQALQRLRRVVRRLILLDHLAEPQGCSEPLARPLIESTDLHLLAGEMVVDEVELQPCVGGIAALRIAAHQLAERIGGILRARLVPGHVLDLLIMAHRDQIMGVGRVLVARVDRQEALGGADRFRIFLRHVIAEGAHHLRPAGPDRIRVLPLDLVEQLGRFLVEAAVHTLLRERVQAVHVTGDIGRVGAALVPGASGGGKHDRAGEQQEGGTGQLRRHEDLISVGPWGGQAGHGR